MSSASTRLTKYDLLLLVFLVITAFSIRMYFVQFYQVISADGISYITIAKEFITGKGLTSAQHYPPFYPILVGLTSVFINNFETAGLAVSIVMGSLLAIPVYLLGTDFFSKKVGLIAAILSITWPTLRYWSTNVMSQATYITLILFGIYFLWNSYKRDSIYSSILAGIFFACAHLTRSEAILVLLMEFSVIFVFTLINRDSPKKLYMLLICTGIFFLVFSPYLLLLHDLTGKWQLTGKSKIAIADALSEYLGKPDIKHDPSFQEIGYIDLFRMYPDYIRTNYLKNIKTCWNEMLPFYGWILAIIGYVTNSTKREALFERVYLLASLSPLVLIIVIFFVGPEYTQPYLPVLFLGIGNGMLSLSHWASTACATNFKDKTHDFMAYTAVCSIVLYGAWNVIQEIPSDRNRPYVYTNDGGRFDDKRIGLRLSRMLPPHAIIMTRSGRIGFYSNHTYVTPPQTDYSGIIDYAKKNKVDYLIATMQLLALRPQLEFLYTPVLKPWLQFSSPPELELINIAQEPGGIPYLVYRIK